MSAICPKCKANGGGNWSQCKGACPMPMSPHYAIEVRRRKINIAWSAKRLDGRWVLEAPTQDVVEVLDDDESSFAKVMRVLCNELGVRPRGDLKPNIEAAYARYFAGANLEEVARQYEVTPQYLGRVFEEFGYKKRPRGVRPVLGPKNKSKRVRKAVEFTHFGKVFNEASYDHRNVELRVTDKMWLASSGERFWKDTGNPAFDDFSKDRLLLTTIKEKSAP